MVCHVCSCKITHICEGREGPHTLEQEGDQAEAVDFASLEELQHAVAAFPTRPAVLVARFGTSLLVAKSLQVGDAEPPSWLLAQVKEHELSKCYLAGANDAI